MKYEFPPDAPIKVFPCAALTAIEADYNLIIAMKITPTRLSELIKQRMVTKTKKETAKQQPKQL